MQGWSHCILVYLHLDCHGFGLLVWLEGGIPSMNAILRASCSLLQIDVVFGVCQFLDYQVLFPNTCSKLSTIFQREMCGKPPIWLGNRCNAITSIPCVHGIYSSGGLVGGLSLSKDLYMPKCRPNGHVVVPSGHFRNPCIRRSKSSRCSVISVIGRRLCWCWSKSRVAGAMLSSCGGACPSKILSPNGVMPSNCSSSFSGDWVKGVDSGYIWNELQGL